MIPYICKMKLGVDKLEIDKMHKLKKIRTDRDQW